MAISRPLSPMERIFVSGSLVCQVGMTVENKAARDFLIERLKTHVLAFRLTTDERVFHVNPTPSIPVHPLPDGFPSLEHACIYTSRYFTPPKSVALGSIAANDTTVILNVNHVCLDGGYAKLIVQHIFDDKLPEAPAGLPIAGESVFASQLAGIESTSKIVFVDDSLTRIYPSPTDQRPRGSPARYVTFPVEPASLPVFDKKTGKLRGLTDHMWASEILAASAFNGTLGNVGTCTCLDLRQFFPTQPTWEHCLAFACVIARGEKAALGRRFGDLSRSLRESFQAKIRAKDYLNYLAGSSAFLEGRPDPPPPGVGVELTNVGAVTVVKPFVDVWMQQTSDEDSVKGIISLQSSQLVKGKEAGPLVQRCRYAPSELDDREARIITKMIAFAMKTFDERTEITRAFDELTRFKQLIE
jgi:hypothetical protein